MVWALFWTHILINELKINTLSHYLLRLIGKCIILRFKKNGISIIFMINELIQIYFQLFYNTLRTKFHGWGRPTQKSVKIEPSQSLIIPQHWSLNVFHDCYNAEIINNLSSTFFYAFMEILPTLILFELHVLPLFVIRYKTTNPAR